MGGWSGLVASSASVLACSRTYAEVHSQAPRPRAHTSHRPMVTARDTHLHLFTASVRSWALRSPGLPRPRPMAQERRATLVHLRTRHSQGVAGRLAVRQACAWARCPTVPLRCSCGRDGGAARAKPLLLDGEGGEMGAWGHRRRRRRPAGGSAGVVFLGGEFLRWWRVVLVLLGSWLF